MNTTVKSTLLNKLHKASEYKDGIKATCPFHDEVTPSFFIFYKWNKWLFKCHGCGKSGTLEYLLFRLKLPSSMSKMEFHQNDTESYETLYKLDYTIGFPRIYDYFNTRGINNETCKVFGFCFDISTPSAVMPVYFNSRFKGTIRRNLNPNNKIRYIIEKNMDIGRTLWGYDYVSRDKPVVLTEGIIDAAVLWSYNIQAIALIGKTYEHKLGHLKTLNSPLLLPDNGDKASFDNFLNLQKHMPYATFLLLPPDVKDISEFYQKKGHAALAEWLQSREL